MKEIINQPPAWMSRALNPETPMTEARETVRTISMDGKLFPTIRMIDGVLTKLSDKDAYDFAIKEGDFVQFENDAAATEFSKMLSKLIGQKRNKTILSGAK
jgi:hypothetical protein